MTAGGQIVVVGPGEQRPDPRTLGLRTADAVIGAHPEQTHVSYAVTLIPGDGIGPELADATVAVLEATGIAFAWELVPFEAWVSADVAVAADAMPLEEAVAQLREAGALRLKNVRGSERAEQHSPGQRPG